MPRPLCWLIKVNLKYAPMFWQNLYVKLEKPQKLGRQDEQKGLGLQVKQLISRLQPD